jgi:hypothetical protein
MYQVFMGSQQVFQLFSLFLLPSIWASVFHFLCILVALLRYSYSLLTHNKGCRHIRHSITHPPQRVFGGKEADRMLYQLHSRTRSQLTIPAANPVDYSCAAESPPAIL